MKGKIGIESNKDIPAKIVPTPLTLIKKRVLGLYFPRQLVQVSEELLC